jgi:hypothetical protein
MAALAMTKAARKPHPPVTMEDTCNYADAQRAGGEDDDTFSGAAHFLLLFSVEKGSVIDSASAAWENTFALVNSLYDRLARRTKNHHTVCTEARRHLISCAWSFPSGDWIPAKPALYA